MASIAHVVNPVLAAEGSELARVQPFTWESLRMAKEFSTQGVTVQQHAVCFTEDSAAVPSFLNRLPDLQRSVLDVGAFSSRKKLPLIADIINALAQNSTADYFIYTNSDIILLPHFYDVVAQMIEMGHDAIVINRRGVSPHYKEVSELPLIFAELGHSHPGYDCFVFHRSMAERLVFGNICVGYSYISVAFLYNLIAFAKNMKHADDLHLTAHLGREVMPPLQEEFHTHNQREFETKVLPHLEPFLDIRKFPYATLPLHKRLLKWLLNPNFQTHRVLEMEGKNWWRNAKFRADEVRFRWLQRIK